MNLLAHGITILAQCKPSSGFGAPRAFEEHERILAEAGGFLLAPSTLCAHKSPLCFLLFF